MQTATTNSSIGLKIRKPLNPTSFRYLLAFLAALASALFFQDGWPGTVLALVYLIPLAALAYRQQRTSWTTGTMVAAGVAILAIASIAIEPGYLNCSMGWLALAYLALIQSGADAWAPAHLIRSALFRLLGAPLQMLQEIVMIQKLRKRAGGPARLNPTNTLLLPVIAAVIFGILLMIANPVIQDFVHQFGWADLFTNTAGATALTFVITLVVIWPLLRMATLHAFAAEEDRRAPQWHSTYFRPVSVALTLALLNAMFLAENLLDIRYVWLDGQLPAGMTHAAYVHRGAYTLIVTALFAAALMIVALRPNSATEASSAVRGLVYLWAAQNILLVASSIKRTLAYIGDYGMSEWRPAGLIWMGLVVFGLASITLRILTRRSNRWLLDVNVAATSVLLIACGFMNFKGFIADRNVERALASTRTDATAIYADLDMDYLRSLGPAALPALRQIEAELEPHARNGVNRWIYFQGNRSYNPQAVMTLAAAELSHQQSSWRSWTLRRRWIEARPP